MNEKRLVALFLLVIIVSVISGCGSNNYFEDKGSEEAKEEQPGFDPNSELIEVGKTVTVPDVCEIGVERIRISNDVKPENPGSVYSQYSADEGKVYVDVSIIYKNLDTSAIPAYDTMKCKLVYSDKYEYAGFSVVEIDGRRDFESSKSVSISPLTTEYIHYLFEVPDEVRTSTQTIDIYMTTGGKNFRFEADPQKIDITQLEIHPGENATEIKRKEVVTTPNSEFNITYATVTEDVLPSNPGDYYSHYEAEPGKLIVDLGLYYKNTSTSKIKAAEIGRSTLVVADRYEYAGFTVAETSEGADFADADSTEILPLETCTLHHMFMVPEDIKATNDPVFICFTVDATEYKYIMR
ncbi:MAG: hypothetical protein K6F93_03290 [Lachnospiraceae bacterium]|nr:hypothetical protein [Lachnospiraceae bacterium]